jgi:hypothetical protein
MATLQPSWAIATPATRKSARRVSACFMTSETMAFGEG